MASRRSSTAAMFTPAADQPSTVGRTPRWFWLPWRSAEQARAGAGRDRRGAGRARGSGTGGGPGRPRYRTHAGARRHRRRPHSTMAARVGDRNLRHRRQGDPVRFHAHRRSRCGDNRRTPRATHPSGRIGDLRRLRDSRRRRRTHPPRRLLDRGAAGTRRRGGGRRRAPSAGPAIGRADRPARFPAPRGRRRRGGRARVGRWPLARLLRPQCERPSAPRRTCPPRRAVHPRSPWTRTCGSTDSPAM